jgi:LysM repeat protein
MFRPTCLVYAASLALVGCNMADKEEAQQDDPSNPHYKQAQQDLDNNNPTAAVADYNAALAGNSKLAGAHYELGLIYGDKLNDPVGSIYHFKRFLELDPTSAKKDEVQALIDKQSQAFAASLPNSPTQNADDYAKLQGDNAALKKQVSDATRTITQLQKQLTQAMKHHGHVSGMTAIAAADPAPAASDADKPEMGSPPATADSTNTPPATDTPVAADTAPATNAAPMRATAVDTNAPDVNAAPVTAAPIVGTNGGPVAPAAPARSYTVVKGDSVWKIAKKMYPGDTKNGEDKILGANAGLDPKRLKIGQVLVVP